MPKLNMIHGDPERATRTPRNTVFPAGVSRQNPIKCSDGVVLRPISTSGSAPRPGHLGSTGTWGRYSAQAHCARDRFSTSPQQEPSGPRRAPRARGPAQGTTHTEPTRGQDTRNSSSSKRMKIILQNLKNHNLYKFHPRFRGEEPATSK